MVLTYNQFAVLGHFFDSNSYDKPKLSNLQFFDVIEQLLHARLLYIEGLRYKITDKGLSTLENYKVESAVILAAGMGTRLLPETKNKPKPMVEVNGKSMIESQIEALIKVGIENITVITGYKYQKLHYLLTKYPFIEFRHNDRYETSNNIVSVAKAFDCLSNSYLIEGDLYVTNDNVIRPYEYKTRYTGIKVDRTNDWNFTLDTDDNICQIAYGNSKKCYQYIGISYWSKNDGEKLSKHILKALSESKENKNIFYEQIPFVLNKHEYKIHLKQINYYDAVEIDTVEDLKKLSKIILNTKKDLYVDQSFGIKSY